MKNMRKGFTVIELMVVIIGVGVVGAIVMGVGYGILRATGVLS